ncbi:MAG: 5'/3'-nucleotidase SurE [Gracilibacteraceae bacterium]|jgi:5'-nucleotidase|nr:5'/3'-nucleotidase SurE [Gracilibacteraceae bacterium]
MRILLTNDDGFQAQGLQALYRVLAETSRHQICIVAPENQQSAKGRSITLHKPLFLTRHTLRCGGKGFAVTGTPTDCVKLALQGGILPFEPELVLSGINAGPNLGSDVFYSGTVAAAMESMLIGVKAFALSLAVESYTEPLDFEHAAAYVRDVLLEDPVLTACEGLLNVNFPYQPQEDWQGARWTRLGREAFFNNFEVRRNPLGREYYWIYGNQPEDKSEGTDHKAIADRCVSITPLVDDLTDHKALRQLTVDSRS